MNEPTLVQRGIMLIKTLGSTVAWVAALAVTLVRGKFQGRAGDQ